MLSKDASAITWNLSAPIIEPTTYNMRNEKHTTTPHSQLRLKFQSSDQWLFRTKDWTVSSLLSILKCLSRRSHNTRDLMLINPPLRQLWRDRPYSLELHRKFSTALVRGQEFVTTTLTWNFFWRFAIGQMNFLQLFPSPLLMQFPQRNGVISAH